MPTVKRTNKKVIEDSDSDAEVDQLDESQYGGGPGSRNSTPRRPRRPSATPPPIPTPTRLRTSITQTSRAQDADMFLGRAVRHRMNPVPSLATPAPEGAESTSALPTNPLPNDNVEQPARHQSEDFAVEDPIDDLILLADESQPVTNLNDAGGRSKNAALDDSFEHADQHSDQAPADNDEVAMKRGRRSNETSAALDAVCNKAIEMFESTAREYGLAPEQVFAHFHKLEHRANNTDNAWNIYQRYFRQFVAEEMSRLPEEVRSAIQASGGRVPNAITKQCWDIFRRVHGDKHIDILQKFDDLHHAGLSDQTVAQREKLFNKLCDDIQVMISRGSRRHGFEFVVLAGGNNINQDAGLARLMESNGATGFFQAKCRYTAHEAIGHMKAHICGLASEAHVLATFGAGDELSRDIPAARSAPSRQKDNETTNTPGTTGSVAPVLAMQTRHGRQSPYVENIICENPKDRESRLKYIKAQITAQVWTLGVKWRSDHLFPWKNMVSELGKGGVMVYNWPEDCRIPGSSTSKEGNKGVAELHASEQMALMDAFVAVPHRLYFILLEDEEKKRELRSGKRPVICGIPPPPSSTRERGLQVFVNGKSNYLGSKRRTEEEAMMEDVEAALKGKKKAAGTEGKRTTRRSAKAKVAEPCPNPARDDIEAVSVNGDPVDPTTRAKAKKKARIASKPYIEISEDDGAVSTLADASPPPDTDDASPPIVAPKTRVRSRAAKKAIVAPSDDDDEAANTSLPVFSAKTRVKSRAAKKPIVEPSDDEDEVTELPKGPEDVGRASTAKRKQTDTTDEAVASGHQPKRPRPTPRQMSTIDADNAEADTLENDIFNRASGRARGKNQGPSTVGDAGERSLTAFGERHPKASGARAPVAASERHPTTGERAPIVDVERAPITDERAPIDENERAPSGINETALPPGDKALTPESTRHRVVNGERALIADVERAPITDERAPTDENERAPSGNGGTALPPGDEAATAATPEDTRHRVTTGERAPIADVERAPITDERAPTDQNERAPTPGDARHRSGENERAPTLDNARHRSGDSERAPAPGDERAPTSKDASLRTVEDKVASSALVANPERALMNNGEGGMAGRSNDMVARMVKDREAIDTTDPQPPAMAAATPTGRNTPAYLPLPAVQNVGWPASGASYPPPSSLLFSPNIPATQTPLSPGMRPTNGLMYPDPFHPPVNANVPMPPPPVPGSYPPNVSPEAYMAWQRYGMFNFPFYPGMPGYPGIAAQQQHLAMAAHQQHNGFAPYQPAGTAYPGTPMLPLTMLPPVMQGSSDLSHQLPPATQGSSDPSQQLPPQAPSA